MCFIHKEPIYAEFLKGNDVILSFLRLQLLHFGFKRFHCPLELFYGKTLSAF